MSEETLFTGPRQGEEYSWYFRKGLTTPTPTPAPAQGEDLCEGDEGE